MSTRITFIGAGNMAGALIGGLLRNGHDADSIVAVDPSSAQCERIRDQYGVVALGTLAERAPNASAADVVVFAVKPQVMAEVAIAAARLIGDALVISVAAGIRATDLSRWLGARRRIVRCMPNTPALIGRGVSALAAMPGLSSEDRDRAQWILAAVGETVWVDDESQLDAVTALSGSGPAYVFYFMEAIQRAGESLGLPPAQARALTLETFRGAAELALQSPEAPAVLRDRVTSKGGTTAAALDAMNAGGVDRAIAAALEAAYRRSVQMGEEYGAAES